VSPAGSPTRVEIGTRIKLERAVYSHYLVDSANILNNTPAAPAPELNGGTTITKDGVGADLGFLVHPSRYEGLSGALVITNLIDPGFRINGTDATGAATKYDLQPRSVSVGTAWTHNKFVAALDLADLTRSYVSPEARVGAEYETHRLALRAGYSSAVGFTAGFGWGWFQFAFGNRAPLVVSEALRF
jgi:hypothetical protein